MEGLTNISVVRELMAKHGLRFSKNLGQNFIVNAGICPKIAELGGVTNETGVLEIGAGVGVLTAELAKRAKKVVCVELDSGLLPLLAETLKEYDNITIINGDILKVDINSLITEQFPGMDTVVCANLPYYITSPVIMRFLEEKAPVRSMTLMLQKEAARRICAPLPSRDAGAITVAAAYYASSKILFDVSRGSFLPAPNVDSCVIRLDIRDEPPVKVSDEEKLFAVIKAAFSQRRKMLVNCLSSGLVMDKELVRQLLIRAGVSEKSRAEELTLEDFADITQAITEFDKK